MAEPTTEETLESTSATPVVLVVDDEENIAALVVMVLETAGLGVLEAHSGTEALEIVTSRHIDMLVLDVMLGDMDGFTLLEDLRARGYNLPVLFLTALDALPDKLRGLSLGDDYMTKPFKVQEVAARVDLLLRRRSSDTNKIKVGDIELNEDTYSVTRAGINVPLTPTEFKLLRLLMRNANRVVLRSEILNEVWEPGFSGRANVDTYVSYLRRKIDGPHEEPMITTVRGFGYMLKAVQ